MKKRVANRWIQKKKYQSCKGQAVTETIVSAMALCFAMFMCMMIAIAALAITAGFDTAHSSLRALIVKPDNWPLGASSTTPPEWVRPLAEELLGKTQPTKGWSILALRMNDANTPNMEDPTDFLGTDYWTEDVKPRDRAGYLDWENRGKPNDTSFSSGGGTRARVRMTDIRIAYTIPFTFSLDVDPTTGKWKKGDKGIAIWVDMQLARSKDRGANAGGMTGVPTNHLQYAYPGAPRAF